jgi:hypothetical protein
VLALFGRGCTAIGYQRRLPQETRSKGREPRKPWLLSIASPLFAARSPLRRLLSRPLLRVPTRLSSFTRPASSRQALLWSLLIPYSPGGKPVPGWPWPGIAALRLRHTRRPMQARPKVDSATSEQSMPGARPGGLVTWWAEWKGIGGQTGHNRGRTLAGCAGQGAWRSSAQGGKVSAGGQSGVVPSVLLGHVFKASVDD